MLSKEMPTLFPYLPFRKVDMFEASFGPWVGPLSGEEPKYVSQLCTISSMDCFHTANLYPDTHYTRILRLWL